MKTIHNIASCVLAILFTSAAFVGFIFGLRLLWSVVVYVWTTPL